MFKVIFELICGNHLAVAAKLAILYNIKKIFVGPLYIGEYSFFLGFYISTEQLLSTSLLSLNQTNFTTVIKKIMDLYPSQVYILAEVIKVILIFEK